MVLATSAVLQPARRFLLSLTGEFDGKFYTAAYACAQYKVDKGVALSDLTTQICQTALFSICTAIFLLSSHKLTISIYGIACRLAITLP